MLVHSFSPTARWLEDYRAFAAVLGAPDADNDTISRIGERNGVELYLAWCSGDQRWRQDVRA